MRFSYAMKSPLISIVIPSYNKFKYIEKTLESIVTQRNVNFEVIIQDGGSTDGTLDVIKKYAKKYPSLICYESKKDGGQLDAINKGLLKAKGDIVTFINADDVYEKDALFVVSQHYIENTEALWFVGKGIVTDERDREIARYATYYKNLFLIPNKYNLLLILNYMIQPSVFLSKKAIKKYGLFSGTGFSVMEYDMWLKIGKNEMPVVINKVLSRFRLEKDTKTSTNSNLLITEDQKIVKKYTKNIFLLFLHSLNNIARKVISYFV